MKVLLVNHLLDAVKGGGTAERTYQIARFLDHGGVQCTILTLDIGDLADRRKALGNVRLVAAPCLNERFFVPLLSSADLRALVAEADIVHLSGHWTVLNARVFRACRQLGKPFLFNPAGALRPFGRSLLVKRAYNALIGRKLVAEAAMCVAITQDERADFMSFGAAYSKVRIIPNGIDPAQYELSSESRPKEERNFTDSLHEAPFILFLGRLNSIKGPDLLLDAFAAIADKVPDHHLVLAGPDDGLLDSLQATAARRGISHRVHFPGYVGGSNKSAALRGATLLAIPSRREAMSIVVLEAGACGCPVLFTEACGLSEIGEAGAGIMVPVDSEAIAEALLKALGSPDHLNLIAKQLSRIVANEYLWQVQAARYASLCAEVLRK